MTPQRKAVSLSQETLRRASLMDFVISLDIPMLKTLNSEQEILLALYVSYHQGRIYRTTPLGHCFLATTK